MIDSRNGGGVFFYVPRFRFIPVEIRVSMSTVQVDESITDHATEGMRDILCDRPADKVMPGVILTGDRSGSGDFITLPVFIDKMGVA